MSEAQVVEGGIYLERIDSRVGTGDTAKAATMENYWRAKLLEDGKVQMSLLDISYQPTGYAEKLDPRELEGRFQYLPDFDPSKLDPKTIQADKISARAERHLQNQEYLSAEFEFNKALKLDEDNVRANFGLGKTYMVSGEPDKARDIFRKLSQIEAVLEPRHKHIFNECGINLRKLGMYAEAARYYKRALDLAPNDENLWFNLARALWQGGMKPQAQAAIKRSLQLNPEFEEAKLFLKQMTGNGGE